MTATHGHNHGVLPPQYVGVCVEAAPAPLKHLKKKEQIKRLQSQLEIQRAVTAFAKEQIDRLRDETSELEAAQQALVALQDALCPRGCRDAKLDWIDYASRAHRASVDLDIARMKLLKINMFGTKDEIAIGELYQESEKELEQLRSENLSLLSQVISLERGNNQLQVELSASEVRAALLEEQLEVNYHPLKQVACPQT